MITRGENAINGTVNAYLVPFTSEKELHVSLGENVEEAVKCLLSDTHMGNECGSLASKSVYVEGEFKEIVLICLGNGDASNREIFLAMAAAFKKCKDLRAEHVAVFLDNAKEVTHQPDVAKVICELPYFVSYQFNAYKTVPVICAMMNVNFVTEMEGFEEIRKEAEGVAVCVLKARDFVNHPSRFMTPVQLAKEAVKIGEEVGIEVEIFDKAAIEGLKMGAFLAVSRGAVDEPRLIVMRYHGGKEEEAPVALVGKGVMFDSGGYSLKSKMSTMHDDMGGAAAVIGAINAIAKQKLPINVVAVVAACKNMVSGDAYVPGDILTSMNGKTIEMLNADAEGRLTLADAITYAIHKEGAEMIIDIATLTGAASGAVGKRSAALIVNDEELAAEISDASVISCEKVWRLPADKELFVALKSEVADIRNSNPNNPVGGGVIIAGLFIQEFTEGKPWAHIDMAPVNWLPEGNSYCIKGGTGYGVSLLYETVKIMASSQGC